MIKSAILYYICPVTSKAQFFCNSFFPLISTVPDRKELRYPIHNSQKSSNSLLHFLARNVQL